MIEKRFCFWLLLSAMVIAGCEKFPPAKSQPAAGNEQSAQKIQGSAEKQEYVRLGKEKVPIISRTQDMPSYHWPADFKLPLEIEIQTPEVPVEIQGPSPPIVEEKK
jgi:hypothetical protein